MAADSTGFSLSQVAALVGMQPRRVRAILRAGLLGSDEVAMLDRLTFQDVVLLRTARGLIDGGVAPRRVRTALRRLRSTLPADRTIASLRIVADGRRIVVQDSGTRWDADSGQTLLDFDVGELARRAAPLSSRPVPSGADTEAGVEPSAQDSTVVTLATEAGGWFARAVDLETSDPSAAIDAYRRALAVEPDLPEAQLNLGRLHHERGELNAAQAAYNAAAQLRPGDPTAWFNLGVALEDAHQAEAAIAAYRKAIGADEAFADAYFNLAGVYDRLGRKAAALRTLKTYRQLIGR